MILLHLFQVRVGLYFDQLADLVPTLDVLDEDMDFADKLFDSVIRSK